MEPGGRAAQAVDTAATRSRVRLAVVSLLLTGLAFVQQPGLETADTKFDLVLDPGRFLSRALHLWDPDSALGQLQNQAYGYLWPMGPFYWVGHLLDVPEWAVQRAWLALVLVTAFLGAALLARALGVRGDLACALGGLAFALSPRLLTTLGPISIEAWPSALAPWVLLPLVVGARRGSPRRYAAWSALGVAMVGGVNAAATAAVLPLGAWWLLTRSRGPRRRQLLTWWPVFTLLGTLWWLLPLALLGRYSPPFLDYIESASNTTFPTTLFDTLRGTSNWVPYVDSSSRAGNDLLRDVTDIVNSGVVLAFGVTGLLLRRTRERLFLAGGVLIGLLMVTAGHLGDVQGWAAPSLHSLLDASLAPLRNVHKFDPVLRLPMVLGLAWAVEAVTDRLRAPGASQPVTERFNARVLAAVAAVAVLGAALPAFAGRIPPAGATTGVPGYWTQAATWLDRHDATGTALLLPGSGFGDYVWGAPQDEPFQSLARTPWAVRNAVPLTPAGDIRMLDAVEDRLAQGEGSTGLAAYLRRAGITHLVVRNDLARSDDVPDPVLVHQALADSPGVHRVAAFGPEVGGDAHLEGRSGSRILVNSGWQTRYPAVEVYAVSGAAEPVVQTDTTPVVVGGPEDLLDLADAGVLSDQPTRLAADLDDPDTAPTGPVVLTDGLRRAERTFGRVHDAASQTLATTDPLRLDKPTRDYLLGDEQTTDRWSTTATYAGGTVTASSSRSDANASGTLQRGEQPYAALDGDPDTAWTANPGAASTAWWEVRPDAALDVDRVSVTVGDEPEVVRVRTARGVSAPVSLAAHTSRSIAVPPGETGWVRVEDASGRVGHGLALAEVDVPGVHVTRSLATPTLPDSWGAPDVIALHAMDDRRTGCATVDGDVRCVVDRQVAAEEPDGFRRTVTLPAARDYPLQLRVRPRDGDALLADLQQGQAISVSASSSANPDVRGSALAAIDGDLGTAWTTDPEDVRPELRFSWLGQRRVRGIRLHVDPDAAARTPTTVTLVWPGGQREVDVDAKGRARMPEVRTDQLTVRIGDTETVSSLDFDSQSLPVPVGVSEVRVLGVPWAPEHLSTDPATLPCGSGPSVTVGGETVATSVTASPAQLYAGATVTATPCGSSSVSLRAGANTVDVPASDAFTPVSLVLGSLRAGAVQAVPQVRHGAGAATYQPASGSGVIAVAGNTNPGLVASQDGHQLDPVVLDGWRQGWRLRSADAVTTSFAPDREYRLALLGGGAAFLALLVAAAAAVRRPRVTGPPALRESLWPDAVRWPLALAVGGLLAGGPGLLVGAVCVATAVVLRRHADVAVLLAIVLLGAATLAYVLRPWGSSAGWAGVLAWPHYLVLAAVLLPLVRSLRRSAGSSTVR